LVQVSVRAETRVKNEK